MMRILVPVDGSAPANRPAAYAAALARDRDDARIILVNVQSPETLDVSEVSSVLSRVSDTKAATVRSRKAMCRAIAICQQTPVAFETQAALGPIAETIDRLARRVDADQIVMGTRGMSGLRRLLLGSVATRVAQLARIPMTLVK
jgi:nucleotide-binding universal stress UspA family protein